MSSGSLVIENVLGTHAGASRFHVLRGHGTTRAGIGESQLPHGPVVRGVGRPLISRDHVIGGSRVEQGRGDGNRRGAGASTAHHIRSCPAVSITAGDQSAVDVQISRIVGGPLEDGTGEGTLGPRLSQRQSTKEYPKDK